MVVRKLDHKNFDTSVLYSVLDYSNLSNSRKKLQNQVSLIWLAYTAGQQCPSTKYITLHWDLFTLHTSFFNLLHYNNIELPFGIEKITVEKDFLMEKFEVIGHKSVFISQLIEAFLMGHRSNYPKGNSINEKVSNFDQDYLEKNNLMRQVIKNIKLVIWHWGSD
jgi:hypothetical protein